MKAGQEIKSGEECPVNWDAQVVNVQEMADADWTRWQKEAGNQASSKTASSMPKTAAPKIVMKGLTPTRMYRVGRGDQASLRKDLQTDVTLRPASRRTKAGYQRYVKDLDAMMASSVRKYIEKLEK